MAPGAAPSPLLLAGASASLALGGLLAWRLASAQRASGVPDGDEQVGDHSSVPILAGGNIVAQCHHEDQEVFRAAEALARPVAGHDESQANLPDPCVSGGVNSKNCGTNSGKASSKASGKAIGEACGTPSSCNTGSAADMPSWVLLDTPPSGASRGKGMPSKGKGMPLSQDLRMDLTLQASRAAITGAAGRAREERRSSRAAWPPRDCPRAGDCATCGLSSTCASSSRRFEAMAAAIQAL